LKRVLIISPYFPPSNGADVQRVRMSLPYFEEFGWQADVVCVKQKHSEILKDEILLESLPAGQIVYEVDAFDIKWTSKLGLGSLALRSMWYYLRRVNKILRERQYDLVYFSTTQFPLTILGRYWKNKFNVPYVIDMQDPWHSEYYQDKPKDQRPAKYWFSYHLHKWLEPLAMKKVDGLISVSGDYLRDLKARYPAIRQVPSAIITFGFFMPDFVIASQKADSFTNLLGTGTFNIVYTGRGGADMHQAFIPLFRALKKGQNEAPKSFNGIKIYLIGTSYAPAGKGWPTIYPLAEQYGVGDSVVEVTDRISYYHALVTLQHADALLIPGSDDPRYTASKLYPYLLTKRPLLAILHPDSPAVGVLRSCAENPVVLTFASDGDEMINRIYQTLHDWANGVIAPAKLKDGFQQFSARTLTGRQADLFGAAVAGFKKGLSL
jgi:glycosyltransferase involved in cell wall biosynthesis